MSKRLKEIEERIKTAVVDDCTLAGFQYLLEKLNELVNLAALSLDSRTEWTSEDEQLWSAILPLRDWKQSHEPENRRQQIGYVGDLRDASIPELIQIMEDNAPDILSFSTSPFKITLTSTSEYTEPLTYSENKDHEE